MGHGYKRPNGSDSYVSSDFTKATRLERVTERTFKVIPKACEAIRSSPPETAAHFVPLIGFMRTFVLMT